MMLLYLIPGIFALFMSLAIAVPLTEEGHLVNVGFPISANNSDPKTGGVAIPDPSYTWHDYSTVQIWMGKAKVQIGTFLGSQLEPKIKELLDKECPASPWTIMPGVCQHNPDAQWSSTCMDSNGKHQPCTVVIWEINARWDNAAIREYLIKAAAAGLQAATLQDVGGNCWDMGGDMAGQKACNVGDVVRVNFPPRGGNSNFFHIRIKNYYTGYGKYECCSGKIRQKMDVVMDSLRNGILKEFHDHANDAWYRDSRCIINEWATCPLESLAGV